MIKAEVLILSSQYDFSTDLICDRLRQKGTPFLRINRDHLGSPEWRLALDPIAASLHVEGYGEEWVVHDNFLRSVWFRQPVFLRNSTQSISAQEQLMRSQWMGFLRGLCLFENALWVNHPQATYIAECKPYQLRLASELGFNVPTTAITNDRARLIGDTAFHGPVILKAVDTVLLREDEYNLFPYSSVVSLSDWTDADFVAAPVTCQRLLRPKIDLRVTVVGSELYCAKIVENGRGVDGDWRLRPKDGLAFEPYCLSKADETRCLDLVKQLGLSFAAIDLAETDAGLFFIEVNPTGEWGWLNGRNAVDMEGAICRCLTNKNA